MSLHLRTTESLSDLSFRIITTGGPAMIFMDSNSMYGSMTAEEARTAAANLTKAAGDCDRANARLAAMEV